MSESELDPVAYYVGQADMALSDAIYLIAGERWNSAMNRLYYSCFYLVSALLLSKNVEAKTHKGIKDQFNLLFVKSGLIAVEQGRLFTDLFNYRQKGDYGDFYNFEGSAVKSLISPVEHFFRELKALIAK